MDLDEIKHHIELYTQRVSAAANEADKQTYTNMLNVWKGMEEKSKRESFKRRASRLERNVEKLGLEYSAWEDWAHNLYKITKQEGEYTVESNAREWLKPVVWQVDSDLGALEKVYRLVVYKIQDRKRGRGDVLRDLGLIKDV